jgi:hypothetical protein
MLPALLALTSFAAAPTGMGEARVESGVRVTLLSVQLMSTAELRGAAGGRVIQWLISPDEGVAAPVFGEVRLFVDGKLYNAVVNASSSKPLAPDLVIDDARKLGFGADPLAATVLSPGALIATVLIRGAALAPGVKIETSLQLGLWPRGTKAPKPGLKPRYVEFRAKQ